MKSSLLHNLIKILMVNGLALLFVLLAFSATYATAAPAHAVLPLRDLAVADAGQTDIPRPIGVAAALQPALQPEMKPAATPLDDRAPVAAKQLVEDPLHVLLPGAASNITVTNVSQLVSGTLSQDWGDFDRDGYLDLAVGTLSGVSIYRNLAGSLALTYIYTPGAVYNVRWADLNNDGLLELMTAIKQSGPNPIYRYTGTGFIQYAAFTSTLPIVRLAVLSGTRDLIASTSVISASCSVFHYQNTSGYFTAPPTCVSTSASAGISAGDFDNDGDSDLVLGSFPNDVKLLINVSNVLTETKNSYTIDVASSWPYDFAWGDYDGDGRFDLAATFPLQRQVRIYHNEGTDASAPFKLVGVLPAQRFMTPLSLDWGDFNGDGALDLATADDPPRIHFNISQTLAGKSETLTLADRPTDEIVWGTRAVALKNSDLSLALNGRFDPTELYAMSAGHLGSAIAPIAGVGSANSLAWGDANGDGGMDLLLGASTTTTPSALYLNVNGSLSNVSSQTFARNSQQSVAFGKLDRKADKQLGLVVGGTDSANRGVITVYTRTYGVAPRSWQLSAPVGGLALGDFNNDGWLDLLIGTRGTSGNGSIFLYRNNQGSFDASPAFTATLTGQVHSVAWGDYDAQHQGTDYLDFAVATSSQVYVYHNEGNNTFTLNTIPDASATDNTALAWGDFTRDGQPELVVGTNGGGVRLYSHATGSFSRIWTSAEPSHVASLAIGDWNNDGLNELAVGNTDEPVQVYADLSGTANPLQLVSIWTSQEVGNTTAVAWGDVNNDGYLDLAVSRQAGSTGVYYNTAVTPWRLPNPPSYLSVTRPGQTFGAYLYSSSDFVPGYINLAPPTLGSTATVYYTIANPLNTIITNTELEFSLDGGSTWQAATYTSTLVPTQTSALGQAGIFVWDALQDNAFSDNALLRIRVVDQQSVGPFQRAAAVAVSPPFRARAMTCQWLTGLWIDVTPKTNILPFDPVQFEAQASDYSGGTITYTWNLGNGVIKVGTRVNTTYQANGDYVVSVQGESSSCPRDPLQAITSIHVGPYTPTLSSHLYLPLIQRAGTTVQSNASERVDNRQPRAASVAKTLGGATTCLAQTILPATRPTVDWLASTIGYHGQPALNHDGSRFAFWSTANLAGTNSDGNIELYYAQVNRPGSCVTFTQITSSTGNILQGFSLGPALNADGDRLAFFSDRDLTGDNGDENFEIFLAQIDPAGSISVTQVTHSARGVNALPAITAVGDHVAFVSDQNYRGSNSDGNQEVYVAAIDPVSGQAVYTQVTQTSLGTFNDEPAISVNGQHIAFVRGGNQTGGLQEIFTGYTEQPGSLMAVTASPAQVLNYHPTIGGDGGQYSIAYATSDLTHEVVHLATIAGANVSITPVYTTSRNSQPALNSADGSRLLVVSGTQRISVLTPGSQSAIPVYACANPDCVYSAMSGDGMHVAFASKGTLQEAYYETATLALALNQPTVPVVAGRRLTRTLVLTNSGPGAADGVEFFSALQAGGGPVLSTTVTTSPDGVCSGSETVTCRIPGIAGNSRAHITLTTNQEIDPGQLAPITLSAGANAWQAITTTTNPIIGVSSEADLRIAKSVASSAVAGEFVTYTLTITNLGPSHARYVTLTDRLPADLTFYSQRNIDNVTFALTNTAGMITDTIDLLQRGASATIQIVAQLSSTARVSSLISNTSMIASVTFDPALGNNQSRADFIVTTRSDLAVTKSAPAMVTAGLPLTYTIVVTNAGPSTAYGVMLTDSLPFSLTVSTVPTDCSKLNGDTQLVCTLSPLDEGKSYTITFMANTDSDIEEGSSLTNAVLVSATNAVKTVSNTATTETAVGSYLYITKTATTAVAAGDPLTYTITVENRGPSTARRLTVTDLWPGNYISYTGYSAIALYPGGNPGYCGYTPGQVVCFDERGLPNGRAQRYYLYATTYQTLALGTRITNTASVTAAGATLIRYDTATTDIDNTLSRLTAAKSADATVMAGNSVYYTIVVTNSGPSYAPFVTVTDQLPTGVTFLSAGSSPTCGSSEGSTVSCTLQNLYVGATQRQTVTIVGNVSYTVASGTVLTNTAAITASNAAASVNVTATTAARTLSALAIDKTATDFVTTVTDPFASGEIVTYTVVVTNNGPSLARDVVLTDVLPVSVTYLSQVSALPPVTPTVAGHTLTWALNTIAPSATTVITFNARVITTTAGPATLTNTAYVTASTASAVVSATNSTFVLPRVRLAVTKTLLTPQPIAAGSLLTYQIVLQNLGPSVVPSVTITDELQAWADRTHNGIDTGTSGITWSGATCTRPANSLTSTCIITPELAAGASRIITLTAKTTRYLSNGPTVTNTVYATATIATAVVSYTEIGTTVARASLLVTKTLSPLDAVPVAGQSLTYSITVGNLGPSDAPSVILTDTLPSELLTPTVSAGCSGPSGRVVTCAAGSIDVGSTWSITIAGQVPANLPAGYVITNSAQASTTIALSIATTQLTNMVTVQANLRVSKSAAATARAGAPLTYTLVITNDGPSPAPPVTVTDMLPISVTYLTQVGSLPSITVPISNGNWLTWTLTGGLAPLATQIITFNVQVTDTVGGSVLITNTAYATSTSSPAVAIGSAVTQLQPQANLLVTKTVASLNVAAGESLTYTVAVGNQGPSDASTVIITDRLSAEMSFVSASPGYIFNNGVVTFALSNLNRGAQSSITITGRITTSTPGGTVITNTAYVTSPAALTGISSWVTKTIASRASLRVTKQAPSPVLAGNPLTYTISITNDGPSLASIITLTDQLTTRLTLDVVPGGCNRAGNVITCTLSDVGVGAASSRSVVLTPTVNSNIVSGTQIINTAVVSGSNAVDSVSHTITTTIQTAANLAINTTIRPTSVYSNTGGPVKVTIVFTNAGPSDAQPVLITETLAVLTYTQAITQPAYVSGPTTGSDCGGTGRPQRCTWSIAILTGTLTGTIEFTATAPITGVSYTQNITAQIASLAIADPDFGDNTSTGPLIFARVLPGIYWAGLLPTRWPVALTGVQPRDVWSLSP